MINQYNFIYNIDITVVIDNFAGKRDPQQKILFKVNALNAPSGLPTARLNLNNHDCYDNCANN